MSRAIFPFRSVMARTLLVVGLAVGAASPGRAVFRQTVEQASIPGVYSYRYLLSTPPGYGGNPAAKWPLLIFLHGSGQSGSNIELVAGAGPTREIELGRELPVVVVSPQAPFTFWDPAALEEFIQDRIEQYHIDPDRVYVTGLSMGGYGTWDLAVRHPEKYAAVVPVCGGGDVFQAFKLRDLPLWAFHGNLDTTVPVARTQDMINAIRQAGGNPLMTIYPDLGHDVWTITYANDSLYDWLFKQSRVNAVIPPSTGAPPATIVPIPPAATVPGASYSSHGGGGAVSEWFLLALVALGIVRHRRRNGRT